MFTYVGERNVAGSKLKSKDGWISNGNGEDFYGFAVLPAGFWDSGDFYDAGFSAHFWSSTEDGSDFAYNEFFRSSRPPDVRFDRKARAHSVRCLRN